MPESGKSTTGQKSPVAKRTPVKTSPVKRKLKRPPRGKRSRENSPSESESDSQLSLEPREDDFPSESSDHQQRGRAERR